MAPRGAKERESQNSTTTSRRPESLRSAFRLHNHTAVRTTVVNPPFCPYTGVGAGPFHLSAQDRQTDSLELRKGMSVVLPRGKPGRTLPPPFAIISASGRDGGGGSLILVGFSSELKVWHEKVLP